MREEKNMDVSKWKTALESVMRYVPMTAAGICAVAIVVAFVVGFKKGFRRVGWGCCACLIATGAFAVLNGILLKTGRVLNFSVKDIDARTFTTCAVALVCVVATLVVYGLLALIFRPSYRIVNKNPVRIRYGIEVEQDEAEHMDGAPPRTVKWRNAGNPKLFGRFLGGLICAVNAFGICAVVLSLIVLVIDATSLGSSSVFSAAMGQKAVITLLSFAKKYALDFITVSAIVLTAFKGYKKGLVGSIRSLLIGFGGVVLSGLAFALPFMNGKFLIFTPKLVARCTALLGGVPEMFRAIAGKLLAGVLLCVCFLLLLTLANYVLYKVNVAIIRLKPVRMLDGTIACLLYVLLGVVIVVGVWGVLYALEYCGLLHISEVFSEQTSLSGTLFQFAEKWVKPLLEKITVK